MPESARQAVFPERTSRGLQPVENVTLHDRVYRKLREALMRGAFTPGQSVTLRDLADELGTSPLPVRLAVHRLIVEGAFEATSPRAMRVVDMTRRRLEDISNVRVALEGMAAEEAVARISADESACLASAAKIAIRAGRNGEIDACLDHDREFHFVLYGASRCELAISMIQMTWMQLGPMIKQITSEELPLRAWEDKYARVLNGLKKADRLKVRQAICQDIQQAASRLAKHLP